MRIITYLLGVVAFVSLGVQLHAQSLHFTFPEENVLPDSDVAAELTVDGMDNVVSMQFSIHFDADVISYQDFEMTDLANIAIGDNEAAQGILRFSWFDVEGLGVSLGDNSSLFRLNFVAIGNLGEESPLSIENEPLEIQLYQLGEDNGNFVEMSMTQDEGLIRIIDEGSLVWSIQHISCAGLVDGAISFVQGEGDYTFLWSGPDGFEANTQSISNLTAGEYTVIISNSDGEVIDTQSFIVIDATNITANITIVDTDCTTNNGAANIVATGGNSPYSYTIGTSNNTTGVFENLEAGTYTVSITDANGCAHTETFEIAALNAPAVDIPAQIELCGGQDTTLTIDNYTSILWSTGHNGTSITINEAGTYSVVVTNDLGCSASDSVQVFVDNTLQLTLENDFLDICPKDSLQIQINGANHYEWISSTAFLSDTTSGTPLAFPDSTRSFSVVGSNGCGEDTLSFEVEVLHFEASAGNDTCIVLNTDVWLNASGGVSYQWLDNRFPVSSDTIAAPRIQPQESTLYVVDITNEAGCTLRDSVAIEVLQNPIEDLVFPNLITPNDDNANDVLEFTDIEKLGQNSLYVYNRWGNLVYSKVNYQSDEERFDGTHQGKKLPAGNYFYIFKIPFGEIKQGLTIVY